MYVPQDLEVTVGNCIGDGWRTVKDNMGQFMLVTLIYFGIMMGLSLIPFLGDLAKLFIQAPLDAGVVMYCLLRLRRQYAETGYMFHGFRQYGKALGVFWLEALLLLAIMLPVMAIIIPIAIISGAALSPLAIILLVIVGLVGVCAAIYVGLGFSLSYFFILDRDCGAWDCIKSSWYMVKGHRGKIFLIGLVGGLINILGALMLLVGLLVTIPIMIVAMASVYHRLSLIQSQPQETANYQPPPPSAGFGPVPPPTQD